MKLSVIIPAHNEEGSVKETLYILYSTLLNNRIDHEIVVINDNSSDKTSEIAKNKGVRVVHRSVNAGAGAARRTGIKAATGEVIVMLDADDTYEAKDIPSLLIHFPEFDQVNGARTSEKGNPIP